MNTQRTHSLRNHVLAALMLMMFVTFICGCATNPANQSAVQEDTLFYEAFDALKDALNEKDFAILEQFIDEKYMVEGLSPEMSLTVLQQVVGGYSRQITQIDIQSVVINDTSIDVRALVIFAETPGEKESKTKEYNFVLSEKRKFQEIGLFSVKTKKLEATPEKNVSVPPFMQVDLIPVGNLIAVKATVDQKEGLFLIDSGAPSLVLNSRHYNFEPVESIAGMGVSGQISGADIQRINEFNWQTFSMKDTDALVMDLSHLEDALDKEFFGLIGFRELEHFELLFDYKANKLILFGLKDNGEKLATVQMEEPGVVIDFSLRHHIPVIECHYLLSIDYYDMLKPMLKNIESDTLSGADKASQSVCKCAIDTSLPMGLKFAEMNTVFSDISHLNQGRDNRIDGLLGYELFSRQLTSINFRTKKLAFWKITEISN